ncbi:MAG TPA: cytochrome C oxidase subunit IV family protein [Vicinamibacterales bacterium]|jgi:cytochrome c oxidase subunit 4|nr:cytochrome C oxidase subunit IV family protein [Vicinamibacterales bacterium]
MSEPVATAHAVNVRGYLSVFATLLVLTLVTVGVASLDLTEGMTVLVAVSIATFKAGLVALFFMHLKGEKPMVFWSLGLTGVLLVTLFAFVLWTEGDHLLGTKVGDAFGTAPAQTEPVSPKPQGGGGH